MVGPDDIQDPTKVARAADVLIEKYGDDALRRARELERDSSAKPFAGAVRAEIERRLASTRRGK